LTRPLFRAKVLFMKNDTIETLASSSPQDDKINSLYRDLLKAWNRQSAQDFAKLFLEKGYIIGFDGSHVVTSTAIGSHLTGIFGQHPTAFFVGKVRSLQFLTPDTALLCAIAGMVPRGQNDINPAVNAIQNLVAVQSQGQWKIASFQNTPAALHGRPEVVAQMSEELRTTLRSTSLN